MLVLTLFFILIISFIRYLTSTQSLKTYKLKNMASIEELSQLLQEKENEMSVISRELSKLQSQLDESREKESQLKSDMQTDSTRNNDYIRDLTNKNERLQDELRKAQAANRQLETARAADSENTHAVERELRIALLNLHNREGDLEEFRKRQQDMFEAQEHCEKLKKRVMQLEQMQKEVTDDYKFSTTKVMDLEKKLQQAQADLAAAKRDAAALKDQNDRLNEEMDQLLTAPAPAEIQQVAKPLIGGMAPLNLKKTSDLEQPDDTAALFTNRRLVDHGGAYYTGGLETSEDYLQTPRRGSIVVHKEDKGSSEYAEPLLKAETMAVPAQLSSPQLSAILNANRRMVDREVQTIYPMAEEKESKDAGCPQCVIC